MSDDVNVVVDAPIEQVAESAQQAEEMSWLLRDKFKGETDAEIIRQQAMAYPELQNRMGKYFGAPKEGGYDLTQLKEFGIEADDPIFNGMQETFKKMGLNQEAIKEITSSYDASLRSLGKKIEEDLARSMTPEFAQKAQKVESWMKKFPKEEQERMSSWLQSTEDFDTFTRLIAFNPDATPSSNNVVPQGASYGQRFETSKQVERLKADPRYKKDQDYRNEIGQRMREALIRESIK